MRISQNDFFMSIKNIFEQRLSTTMIGLGLPPETSPLIRLSVRPEFGDYQANGVMRAAKLAGENPRQLAKKILAAADLSDLVDLAEVAGPGFINFHLNKVFIARQLSENDVKKPSKGVPKTVVIDYSGPNLAKEMHVGHLRSTIIGDCIARIHEYLGNKVIRQNHMGDWGTQFGMLIAELEYHTISGKTDEFLLDDLEKFYQRAKTRFDSDNAFADQARKYVVRLQAGDQHCLRLWQHFIEVSVQHNLNIYQRLNVSLKKEDIKAESSYNHQLEELVSRLSRSGIAVDDQGAKVIFLDDLSDKNGRASAMIIRKSDGGYLYATTDLAALEHRAKVLKADRILYFVDARQALHMKQLFSAGKLADLVSDEVSLEHHSFGTMMAEDGKPFKTRAGGTVKLENLIDEAIERAADLIAIKNPKLDENEIVKISKKVGIGAIKYADLSKHRSTDYVFDWDVMLSLNGNTGPYLQYAYTRICSIFKRAKVDMTDYSEEVIINNDEEKNLCLKILQFNEVLEQVAQDSLPHLLCSYLYELAGAFMSFYEKCPVLKSTVAVETCKSRLTLCSKTGETICTGLDLLGIEITEQM